MFKKLKKKAFTLVELLVVIAILAILASVSVVGYLGFTENARKSKAVTELTQYKTMLLGELASGSATLDNGTVETTDDVKLSMPKQGEIRVIEVGTKSVNEVLNQFFGTTSIQVKYHETDKNLIIYIDYTTNDNATSSWNISTDEVVAGTSMGGSETDPTDPEEPGDEYIEKSNLLIFTKENKPSNAGGVIKNDGLDYSLDAASFNFDNMGRGLQIGSSNSPQNNDWSISTSFNEEIILTKYIVELCVAKDGIATYAIDYDSIDEVDAKPKEFKNTDVQQFVNEGLNCKTTSFKVTLKASKKAMYIKSISLTYKVKK
ncbi:MAG: type II secretion system protein [Bacilli bacterium]|nr:type II secretion system protein [Bacilli bacterium]